MEKLRVPRGDAPRATPVSVYQSCVEGIPFFYVAEHALDAFMFCGLIFRAVYWYSEYYMHPDYFFTVYVCESGTVWRRTVEGEGRIKFTLKKSCKTSDGRLQTVVTFEEGYNYMCLVHRLVAETFSARSLSEEKLVVDHFPDANPTHNYIGNLRLITAKLNTHNSPRTINAKNVVYNKRRNTYRAQVNSGKGGPQVYGPYRKTYEEALADVPGIRNPIVQGLLDELGLGITLQDWNESLELRYDSRLGEGPKKRAPLKEMDMNVE